MKINILTPHGFCNGVKKAIDLALNTNNEITPIYALGHLIHNKEINNILIKKNITTINNNIKRIEMLDLIDKGSIIISAHGASPDVYKKALNKGLNIIDTTCPYVKMTHNKIIEYIDKNYDIYYIGTPNHPECEGVLGISNKINLISNINDIDNITFNDNSFIINQTTLSIYEIKEIHEKIRLKNNKVIISNTICNATTLRQKALLESNKVDLTIVVGDKLSSNTKKLYQIASTINNTIMIEKLNDISDFDFSNIHEINITSGASTPEYIFNEIIDYLKKQRD